MKKLFLIITFLTSLISANIVVEDKTSLEKNISTEYKTNEIFRFSDALVDSLTTMIDKEYNKKIH